MVNQNNYPQFTQNPHKYCTNILFILEKWMHFLSTQKYQDTANISKFNAKIKSDEYDHIEGVLFIDHISAFKRQLLKGKLSNISRGKVNVRYRMKFPKRS